MKRLLIAAVGLTGVLASCGVDVVVDPGPADPVRITQLNSFTSDQYFTRVENGNTVREYYVCANRDNEIYMDTSWTGPLVQLAARPDYPSKRGVSFANARQDAAEG